MHGCLDGGVHGDATNLAYRSTAQARVLLPGRLGASGDLLVGGAAVGIGWRSACCRCRNSSEFARVVDCRCQLWVCLFVGKIFRSSLLLLLEGILVSRVSGAIYS